MTNWTSHEQLFFYFTVLPTVQPTANVITLITTK